MKKRFLVLAMIACILGLTACGSNNVKESFLSEQEAIEMGEGVVGEIAQIAAAGMAEQYAQSAPVVVPACESFNAASEELGNFVGVIPGQTVVTLDDEEIVINVQIQGDKVYKEGKTRTATVEIVLNKESGITSMATNINYDMSEMMTKAALNTVLGMGTVFCVLILISIIISCFSLIGKVQNAIEKKKAAKTDVKTEAVDNTIAQIVEKEEAADDLELIAVISAAIAASEGASSTDGFVVRSIIRR